MIGLKNKNIMEEFIDGTKRIKIDYKKIEDYDYPFVMTLKVKGKNKLDVWSVNDGREANKIREEYKKNNRHTSYKDFYKNIEDLIEEQGEVNLQFKPRIRGKNKKKKNKNFEIENQQEIRTIFESARIREALIINISNQVIVNTLKYTAELRNITPEELVNEIIEEWLKNKLGGK